MSMPLAMFLNASSKFFTSFITYLHKNGDADTGHSSCPSQ